MPLQRTYSPVDGRLLVERELADDAAIAATLERGRDAFQEWRRTPLEQRLTVLGRAVDALESERDVLAGEITWQMGRPIAQSPGEIRGLDERARYMLAAAPRALTDFLPEAQAGFTRFIRHEPLGLVFVVAPWNYPYLTAVNSIIPALAAGNVVLLKHSAQTPLCAERFQAAFDAAGLPPGVFQHLHMGHDSALRIVASGAAALVAFTGSVPAGHAVQAAAGQAFIATNLELGGKDPAYVREDADLAHAVEKSGRRGVLQFRSELLRHRADLRSRAPLRRVRRTAMSSWPPAMFLATRPSPARSWARWSARRPPTSPAVKSTRRWHRAPRC